MDITCLQQERVGGGKVGGLIELIVQQTRLRLLHGDALTSQAVCVSLARHRAVAYAET